MRIFERRCLESPDYSALNPPHRSDRRRQNWTSNQHRGRQHLCSKLVPGIWLWMRTSGIRPHHLSPFWVAKVITPRSKEIIRGHKKCLFNHANNRHAQSLISASAFTCTIAQTQNLCCRRDKEAFRVKWFHLTSADKCVGDSVLWLNGRKYGCQMERRMFCDVLYMVSVDQVIEFNKWASSSPSGCDSSRGHAITETWQMVVPHIIGNARWPGTVNNFFMLRACEGLEWWTNEVLIAFARPTWSYFRS